MRKLILLAVVLGLLMAPTVWAGDHSWTGFLREIEGLKSDLNRFKQLAPKSDAKTVDQVTPGPGEPPEGAAAATSGIGQEEILTTSRSPRNGRWVYQVTRQLVATDYVPDIKMIHQILNWFDENPKKSECRIGIENGRVLTALKTGTSWEAPESSGTVVVYQREAIPRLKELPAFKAEEIEKAVAEAKRAEEREVARVEATKKAEEKRAAPKPTEPIKKEVVASDLPDPRSGGAFGFKWGAPPTGLTKGKDGYKKDGIQYMFSGPNDRIFAGGMKYITREEATSLVKQLTDKYGYPEVKDNGKEWGKTYDWTFHNVPFNFNGEIHPTEVNISVGTGGDAKHGPHLLIMNPEVFKWGVFLKTEGYQ